MKIIKFLPFYLISAIPMRGLYIASDFLFFILYNVAKYRRDVVRKNLENSFPQKPYKEILAIERGFYKHFCDLAFESVKLLTINKKAAKRRFNIRNIELIEQLYRENKDVILYSGHFGNWEWFAFLPFLTSFQVTSFYFPLSNHYFNQLMQMTRSRFGVLCIESNSGFKTLLKLRQNNILTINLLIGDQSPTYNKSKYWTTFLNQETAFLVGADKIAKKMNQTLIFPAFTKTKRGVYEVTFKLIEDNAAQSQNQEITEKYVKVLEESISASPELWLWSHNRWKLSKPTDV